MNQERGLFISLACVLIGIGALMVYSASITSWPTEFEQIYFARHLRFLIIAASLAGISALLPAKFWFRVAPVLLVGTTVLLLLVLIPGIGTRVNGARRWLRLGGLLSIQPSELAKITLVLYISRLLFLNQHRLKEWGAGTVPLLIPMAMTIPLVMLQPDLGTSLFLASGCGIAMFVGQWPLRNFAIGGALSLPIFLLLILFRPYQLRRITGFVDVWSNFQAAPYQLKQSLYSLAAGGTNGVGIGKGTQKLSFLPEANTDFVFAVLGEELGLLGTLGLTGIWIALLYVGLRLLRPLKQSSFEYIAALTLLVQLVFQAAINIAVVTAMVPPKGISHPMISYGGSSLVVSLVSLGIILSLTRNEVEKSPLLYQS